MHTAPLFRAQQMERIAWWVVITIFFSLAYTQSPLYTSNQNQYFLHGLAKAGIGFLSQDWLANTLDPTPVFTSLVEWIYRLTRFPGVFYLLYSFLMGVYLFSLVGIVEHLFNIRRSKASILMYVTMLILAHSAVLRFGLGRGLGEDWAYLLEDGLAGQRLLGPVLQPSVFGILLLFSIFLFLKEHPYLAVLSAALAATIHPTYLLSAASLTIAYIFIIFLEQNRNKLSFKATLVKGITVGLTALVAVTPILLYVYGNFADTPAETTAEARAILVNFRIPHHALISEWLNATVFIKAAFVIAAIILTRRTGLFWIITIPFVIAVSLTVIQVFSQSNALALLFPWRVSALLIPLSTSIILGWLNDWLLKGFPEIFVRHARGIQMTCLAVLGLAILAGVYRSQLEFQARKNSSEQALYDNVSEHLIDGQVYLIPIQMQDFRLASGSPAYIEFKSIPYKDADVLEWKRRITQTNRVYNQQDCHALENMQADGVTHLVLPKDQFNLNCRGMKLSYQNHDYRIYAVQ